MGGGRAPLARRGVRTFPPDQRGYSPGAPPPRRRDYGLDLLVGDVAALIESVPGGRAHVVGHDWGAAVAGVLAAHRPDLVRIRRRSCARSSPAGDRIRRGRRDGPLRQWAVPTGNARRYEPLDSRRGAGEARAAGPRTHRRARLITQARNRSCRSRSTSGRSSGGSESTPRARIRR
ncbi:alpha/beta fold hydrolase [Rhodococcus pyridinivorans]|uniref:alpha/beta fold hydrolase n=1 Tax=Rhodococcus pyridinivorans TaxID=103816 RepID=UPI0027E07165|nr:alpha/beta fold hydrolase [Rhodococcus pyridinivorans]